MRGGGEIMVGKNSEPPLIINKAGVGVDISEVFNEPMVFEYGLNEEHVCITHYSQLTPIKK